MDVRVEGTSAEKSEAGEQRWRREGAGLNNFFYTLTDATCIYADTGALLF